MEILKKLETKGAEIFDTKAPWKMPKNARKSLADALWILALVFGILQLLDVWNLWELGHAFRWVGGELSYIWNYPNLSFFFYLSVLVLIVEAVMLLVAAPSLKAGKKEGWNLLFYAILVHMGYGIVRLFSGFDGLGAFFWALVGTAIAAYFLFQVRGEFSGHSKTKQK